MEEKNGKKGHAIVFPVPYQGHINPTTSLALKLASKGFTITFVHTEFVHHMLSKAHINCSTSTNEVDFFSKARESGLDIRYTAISDGFPLEFDRTRHFNEFWESLVRDFPARVDQFIEKTVKSDPSSAFFLVADTTFAWLPTIAKKYNLVSVSFWTEPALVFSLGYHMDLLQQNGHLSEDVEEEINYLPGVESINTRDMMPYLKGKEAEALVFKALSLAFDEVKKADFVLHNTVQELESGTLSALNQKQPNFAIGPINFFQTTPDTSITVAKSLWSESDCNNWLESKPPGSVLYVSFGSLVQTYKQVIDEIAYGLLLSEVNFIWVVRSDIVNSFDTNDGILPFGFEDEIKDRGLIVPWCNQITVLSNPAVGGFLTHCGWNSILESIWCGVPMLCYPVTYDQPTNRKLVVDGWKIGVNLCDGPSVHREEVARKIKSFISNGNNSSNLCLKKEMKIVEAILKNAIELHGSSERNFDQFIHDLTAKLHSC